MAAPRWFIARNKVRVGPFAIGDLQQLARCGLLQPTEYVWMEGAAKWVEASRLPGLFAPPGQKRYWVAISGQARGPLVPDQIRAALATRQLDLETQACPEDGKEWQPLGQVTEFRSYVPSTVSPSRAQLLVGTLGLEEAELHLAGKSGDAIAKLICTLMDLKRNYAHNTALVQNLDTTIQVLHTKRGQEPAVQ
jgi:GYF domain 2